EEGRAVRTGEVHGPGVVGGRVAVRIIGRDGEGAVIAGGDRRWETTHVEPADGGRIDDDFLVDAGEARRRRVRNGNRVRAGRFQSHTERVGAVVGRAEGEVSGQHGLRVATREVDGAGVAGHHVAGRIQGG